METSANASTRSSVPLRGSMPPTASTYRPRRPRPAPRPAPPPGGPAPPRPPPPRPPSGLPLGPRGGREPGSLHAVGDHRGRPAPAGGDLGGDGGRDADQRPGPHDRPLVAGGQLGGGKGVQ